MKQSAESSTICCAELSVLIGENETHFFWEGGGGDYTGELFLFFFAISDAYIFYLCR